VIATDGRGVQFRIPANFFQQSAKHTSTEFIGNGSWSSQNQVDILVDLQYRPISCQFSK